MQVYHYAKLTKWKDIAQGSYKSKHRPGLGGRPIGQYGDAFNTIAVFAHLDPIPSQWTNNTDFPNVWEHLKFGMGSLLLEIDTDPAIDPVSVVDYGHMWGYFYEDKTVIPAKYRHPSQETAEKKYLTSKVPLLDYLQIPPELQYSLPEIILSDYIPFDKITVSEMQPLLEEELASYRNTEIEDQIRNHIDRVPQLQPWYRNYQDCFGNFNESFSRSSKER